MSDFIFQVKNGRPDFLSEDNRTRFYEELKENEGRKYKIEAVAPNVSDNRRGWYYAAVIPFMKKLNISWKDLSNDDMHEILKQEFNGFEAIGIDGMIKKFGKSAVSREVSVKIFDNFILRIADWVNENYGLVLPDPTDYKKNYKNIAKTKIDIPERKIDYPEMQGQTKF